MFLEGTSCEHTCRKGLGVCDANRMKPVIGVHSYHMIDPLSLLASSSFGHASLPSFYINELVLLINATNLSSKMRCVYKSALDPKTTSNIEQEI